MNDQIVLRFADPTAADPSVTGGKGASLAALTRGGFPVPPGIVVAAGGYRSFIATDPELTRLAEELDFSDHDALRTACDAIRERLVSLELPVQLVTSIENEAGVLLQRGPVSVRSSSTLEDMGQAAFAGQHDTYLNVTTVPDVIDAIRRCYASLWEDRAVRYRVENGFGSLEAAMAVVVQTMIPSEVAGVAFTVNPITGDVDEIVVNAAPGLGETVVSGEGEIDQFILARDTGAVIERTIGDKTHTLVSDVTGSKSVALDEIQRQTACLTDESLATLCRQCVAIEDFYGFPQDIEWAYAAGELYVLQSRPVTRLPARWTRDESAERFPRALTPLTWDFTDAGFHESLAHSLSLMGLPPFRGKWFELLDGYVYGNQTAVRLFTRFRDLAFDGLEDLAARVPGYVERYRWVQHLPVQWARDLDRYLLGLGALSSVDLAVLSREELWNHVHRIDGLGRAYFLPNIAISMTHGALHWMLFRLVAMLVGPEQAPQFYDRLTCFTETKTNLVNRDLYHLYRIARDDPSLGHLLRNTDRRRLWEDGLLSEHEEFATAFRTFLQDHGHREVDFDAYQPTWIGQPWVVLENVRLMLERDEVVDPAERELDLRRSQQQAEHSFLNQLPEAMRPFSAELLRLARAYTALDDLEHYQTTRLNVPFRNTLMELGRRLVVDGALAEEGDIFFLRRATLDSYVNGTVGIEAVSAESSRNRKAYDKQQLASPPHVHGQEDADHERTGALRGLPGSPGTAEGKVCIVRSVDDFGSFVPGSVLVARTTNPAWTPLFYSACAVITESGGPLSHGAVTAREVGIPAVMAVRGVLATLQNGQRVRVNGTNGTVNRIQR